MLKSIGKHVNRTLAALKGAAELSGAVGRALTELYRTRAPAVRDTVFDRATKQVRITAASPSGARIMNRDRRLIHAALRREGFDVRELVVR